VKYIPPYGVTSNPDASYVNGDPSIGRQGSIPPAAVFENPQREIVNLVADSTQTPNDGDLHQTTRAVRDGKLNFCVDSGPLNQLQVVLPGPAVQTYWAGLSMHVLVAHSNTGATRIVVGTLNPTSVKRRDGSELQANDLLAGMVAHLVCDGTYFQLMNDGGSAGTGGDTNIVQIDIPYVRDTGTPNHLIGLYSPPLADLREGRTVEIMLLHNITGATDFKPNNFPIHNVVHPDGSPLSNGDGLAGQVLLLIFDSVNWQLISCCAAAGTTPAQPTVSTGKSLRFWYRQPDQSTHLRRLPSMNGNRQLWTYNMFVKRMSLGIAGTDYGGSIAQGIECWFMAGNAAQGGDATGMYLWQQYYNNQPAFTLFWNYSYWNVAWPGAPAPAFSNNIQADTNWHNWQLNADGAKISCYYDGMLVAQGPAAGNGAVCAARLHEIGTDADYGAPGFSYNEYYGSNTRMCEIYLIDGLSLPPTTFFNNVGGILKPKRYSGAFNANGGVNGSYINFDDSSAATDTTLGRDQSGNNNNWTPFNTSINDVSNDYPG
jgi:hypothetical protein